MVSSTPVGCVFIDENTCFAPSIELLAFIDKLFELCTFVLNSRFALDALGVTFC